jgi:hypothetical protein
VFSALNKPAETRKVSTTGTGEYEWSREQIVAAAKVWMNFGGFTPERCARCSRKANLVMGRPSWICPCGRHNIAGRNHQELPHETPDIGPTRAVIGEALDQARREAAAELKLPETAGWIQIWSEQRKSHQKGSWGS